MNEEIFNHARSLPEGERDDYLREACVDEAGRQSIRALLDEASEADSFFGMGADVEGDRGLFNPGWESRAGDLIGPYILRERIGEGGCGIVWMADQLRPIKRRVAVKLIKPGMDTREVLSRFEAERQALAMMEHPNITRVIDAGATEAGRPYFAMEFVEGIAITDYCREGGLGLERRLELFLKVCAAVNHAHQKGIIHRDLKPSNVLVTTGTDEGEVKVIDFGIAKATQGKLTEKTLVTRAEVFVGTPVYMAPEQVALSGRDADTRSDIYSLGVLLYELLSGAPPFDARTLNSCGLDEMRRLIMEEEPPQPSTRADALSSDLSAPELEMRRIKGELDWIVMKALEKDPDRRYETVSAFSADLDRYLRNEPVDAAPPGFGYKLAKFSRRHRKSLLAGSAAVLVLLAATIVSTWLAVVATEARERESEARSEAEQTNVELIAAKQRADDSRVRRQHEEGKSLLFSADLMLEQKRFLAARLMAGLAVGFEGGGREEQDISFRENHPVLLRQGSEAWLRARRIVDGEFDYPMLWSKHPDTTSDRGRKDSGIAAVAFSSDGSVLVSAGADQKIHLWNPRLGQLEGKALVGHEAPIRDVATSPGNSLLASVDEAGMLIVWDLANGGELWRSQADDGASLAVAFHPDGGSVITGGEDGRIDRWEASSGTALGKPLSGHSGAVYDLCHSPDGAEIASVGADRTLRLWSLEPGAGEEIRMVSETLRAVEFHPDGAELATGSDAGRIQIWKREGLAKVLLLENQGGSISRLCFSPDGLCLASASSADRLIRIWERESAALRVTLQGHGMEIGGIAFAPDGGLLASAGGDGMVRLWQAERAAGLPVMGKDGMGAIHYADDGELLCVSAAGGEIGVYETEHGRKRGQLSHGSAVVATAMSPDGQRLAVTCEDDPRLYLWDLSSLELVDLDLTHPGESPGCLAFSAQGLLVSGDGGGGLALWDLKGSSPLWAGRNGVGSRALKFAPSGETLAVGLADGSIQLWKMNDPVPEPLRQIDEVSDSAVEAIDFSSDGQFFAAATSSRGRHAIGVWETSDWKVRENYPHQRRIRSLAFAPGGLVLAMGDDQRQIHLRDVATGVELTTFREHAGAVVGVDFHPRARKFASCSLDGTVRVWSHDPEHWNSSRHLLAAYQNWFSPEKNEGGSPGDRTELPVEDAEMEASGTYLKLLRGSADVVPDFPGLFWRYCRARNWAAARTILARWERSEPGAAQIQDARRHFAEFLAFDALRLARLGSSTGRLVNLRLSEANLLDEDSPWIWSARAILLAREGDPVPIRNAWLRAFLPGKKRPAAESRRLLGAFGRSFYQSLIDYGYLQGEDARIGSQRGGAMIARLEEANDCLTMVLTDGRRLDIGSTTSDPDGNPAVNPQADMVWIEPGSFTMGSPETEAGHDSTEIQFSVILTRGYYLGIYEVTQARYQSIMGVNPSTFRGGGDLPVDGVAFPAAVDYCAKLTLAERKAGNIPAGWEYRLPTEAEWEYACRAGSKGVRYLENVSVGELGWYGGNSDSRTHPVGQKLPNAWGLHDMYGNIWEWCFDWDGLYPKGTIKDPQGPAGGRFRSIRGGSWVNEETELRSAARAGGRWQHEVQFEVTKSKMGFRVVLAPIPGSDAK